MTSSTGSTSNRPLWIGIGAGVSGLSTYALLALVAAGLGMKSFDSFSLYWSILIVVSVGGYLPLEQIVARHSAAQSSLDHVRGWATWWGLCTAVLGAFALLGTSAVTGDEDISLNLVLIFALNLGAVALQAVLRGLAAGSRRLDVYALVTASDALGRTLLCGILATVGAQSVELYALAIGVGCWSSVALGWILLVRSPSGTDAPSSTTSLTLSGEAMSLVPAMLSMQLLLNSPVFVAFFAPSNGSGAGAILAIGSLVRTSVFVSQAAQAAYVARIAALVHQRSPQVNRATSVVAGLAVALALATVVGSTVGGPWLVTILYGSEFAVGHVTCLAVSLGVGMYLLATVANDLSVARGTHGRSGLYWTLGLAAAALSTVLLPAGEARTLGPIMVGSIVALALTVAGSRRAKR